MSSITLQVYVPADNPLIVEVNPPLDHIYMSIPEPLLVETVAVPSLPPLQVTSVDEPEAA
jgi:hypothetical protein